MPRKPASIAIALLVLSTAALAPSAAHASDVQTTGPVKFPGRFQLGFNPIGAQVQLASPTVGSYKLFLDLSYLVKDYDGIGLWVGGGFNYAVSSVSTVFPGFANYTAVSHDVQLHAFAMLTFNLLQIPLVPFVRAGGAGDVLFTSSNTGSGTAGAGGFRFGGGLHYWIIKQLALGLEMNFLLGGIGSASNGASGAGFYGTWDFGLGMRFGF